MSLISTGRLFKQSIPETDDHPQREFEKRKNYGQAKQTFKTQAFSTPNPVKSFGKPAKGGLDYIVGDRVRHIKFGEGTVMNIVEGGRDFEVTVDFDGAGTKKMFAGFARLQKI